MSDVPTITLSNTVAKATAAWSGVGLAKFLNSVGITTWGDAAAAAAFCYSLVLILEWVYKKVYCPLRDRRKDDQGGGCK